MKKNFLRIKTHQQGFTLVEIIITLVILIILLSTLAVRYISLIHAVDTTICLTNQYSLSSAQTLYYVGTLQQGQGYYAESLDDLVPYINGNEIPYCPRGGEYLLLPEGRISCTIGDHQQ